MFGATGPRSAALQASATPGRARAGAVATLVSRAWASVLRTTPRNRVPSRARSSTYRPWPVRRRWSSFRRGELPIMSNRNLPRARRSPRLDFWRMANVRLVFGKLTLIQLLGNLVGALLTWFYFRFVDFTAPQFQARISPAEFFLKLAASAHWFTRGTAGGR